MKRLSAILAMILILCMCFTACSGNESEADIGEISGVIVDSDTTIHVSPGTGNQESQEEAPSSPALEEANDSAAEQEPEETNEPTTEETTEPTTEVTTEPATEESGEVTTETAHEHRWSEANCTDPATCTDCGKTEGTAFGHKFADGKCTTCGAVDSSYSQGGMVWIPTKGGKKYHNDSECSGMIDPDYVTISEAEALGFTPCKKCYG